ncbi:MAG: hypothetical protein OXG24_04815 [Gammaproteobacteria bacterium]|nr:hypothetical protein [Gammaproteobacteria bacterium]
MTRHVSWLCFFALVISAHTAADSRLRVKLAGDFTKLSSQDVFEERYKKSALQNLRSNVRYMYDRSKSRWSFEFHGVGHGVVSNTGYFAENSSSSRLFDPEPSGYWNLSKELVSGSRHFASVNIDRLRLTYRSEEWRVMIGRLPVSWGRGIVYQPLDVFNAYPPTAIDREFKPGNDSLVVERLFNNGSELQLLSTFRDSEHVHVASGSSSTHVFKGYFASGESEIDLILGRHWDETIVGMSVASPVSSILVRADVVFTCEDMESCTISAVVNADYSHGIMGGLLYTFAEYFYNGFGVTSKHKKTTNLPKRLLAGIQRGEIFAYGRHLIATGASVTWHPLWNQSLSLLVNANDGSFLVQTNITFVPTDNVNLTFGMLLPVGDTNEEFGAIELEDSLTTGGNSGLFFELSYYR